MLLASSYKKRLSALRGKPKHAIKHPINKVYIIYLFINVREYILTIRLLIVLINTNMFLELSTMIQLLICFENLLKSYIFNLKNKAYKRRRIAKFDCNKTMLQMRYIFSCTFQHNKLKFQVYSYSIREVILSPSRLMAFSIS